MNRLDFLKQLSLFFLALGCWPFKGFLRYNKRLNGTKREAMFYRVIKSDKK